MNVSAIRGKSLDGSDRGLIKPSAPNNAYAASQEAGFNSPTTQHMCQPIMAKKFSSSVFVLFFFV
jgi:hypothetical protein